MGRDEVDRRRAPAVDEEDEDDEEELGVSSLGSFRLLVLIEDEEDYEGGVGRR